MNNTATEATLIGILYRYPSLQHLIDLAQFSSKDYRAIAEEAKIWYENNSAIAPQLSMLYGARNEHGAEKYSHFVVQSLIDFCEKNTPKTEEEASSSVAFLKAKTEQAQHEEFIAQKLNEAGAYILKGQANHAVSMLRTLPFRLDKEKFTSTKDYMLSALTESTGFKTGIPAIDDYTGGWYMGNILSICGDTGSQKTRVSLWLVIKILEKNPTFKAVYFEKEMPVKDIARMMLAKYAGIKHEHIIRANKAQREEMKKAVELIAESEEVKDILDRITFIPPTEFATVSDMWKVLEKTAANIWVLDYMSLLDGDAGKSGDKAFVVMDNMKKIKDISHLTGSFPILLNQLNKGVLKGSYKIPSMDDIEWSGDIKKMSAYVMTTFFPKLYYNNIPEDYFYLISLKNRDKANYVVPLVSDPSQVEFEEPEHDTKLRMVQYITDYTDATKER